MNTGFTEKAKKRLKLAGADQATFEEIARTAETFPRSQQKFDVEAFDGLSYSGFTHVELSFIRNFNTNRIIIMTLDEAKRLDSYKYSSLN